MGQLQRALGRHHRNGRERERERERETETERASAGIMSVVSVETEEGIVAETGVEVVSHPVRESLESLGLPIPSSTSWPAYPVLLTQSDGPKSHDRVVQKCASSIPIESSLFRGQTFLYVDDGTLP